MNKYLIASLILIVVVLASMGLRYHPSLTPFDDSTHMCYQMQTVTVYEDGSFILNHHVTGCLPWMPCSD